MAEIKTDFGQAGSAEATSSGKPTIATAMRDVADDLAANKVTTDSSRTRHLSLGILDQGSTSTKFKTTKDFIFQIDGVVYAKAATDDIDQPATTTIADEFAKDLISVDDAGSVTVTGGVIAATQGAAVKPAVPAGEVEIGYIEIPASFTPGSTDVTSGMLFDNGTSVQAEVATIKTTKG